MVFDGVGGIVDGDGQFREVDEKLEHVLRFKHQQELVEEEAMEDVFALEVAFFIGQKRSIVIEGAIEHKRAREGLEQFDDGGVRDIELRNIEAFGDEVEDVLHRDAFKGPVFRGDEVFVGDADGGDIEAAIRIDDILQKHRIE